MIALSGAVAQIERQMRVYGGETEDVLRNIEVLSRVRAWMAQAEQIMAGQEQEIDRLRASYFEEVARRIPHGPIVTNTPRAGEPEGRR
jgi:hypothetical protein